MTIAFTWRGGAEGMESASRFPYLPQKHLRYCHLEGSANWRRLRGLFQLSFKYHIFMKNKSVDFQIFIKLLVRIRYWLFFRFQIVD
jgi:hypothetical protein